MIKRPILPHREAVEEYMSTIPRPWRAVQRFLVHSWWVILYALLCFIVYEKGTYYFLEEEMRLQSRLDQLQQMKDRAIVMQERFKMEINSQSDPDWIELVLMKGLGVVPEGQTKIYFPKKNR